MKEESKMIKMFNKHEAVYIGRCIAVFNLLGLALVLINYDWRWLVLSVYSSISLIGWMYLLKEGK